MSIDFAYAQARAQARLGEQLPEDGWRLLESSLGLPQYLASVRSTVLAPRIQQFSANVTPHTIERTLREAWRSEVADVARWVPDRWQPAIEWAAWTPYIQPLAWLLADEPALPWMAEDPVLAELAVDDSGARRAAICASPLAALMASEAETALPERWFSHWRSLWPATNDEEATGLQSLIDAASVYLDTIARHGTGLRDRRDARASLVRHATRMMHQHVEQPVVVFCHLIVFALELQRLRDGLLRRALFNDETREHAA